MNGIAPLAACTFLLALLPASGGAEVPALAVAVEAPIEMKFTKGDTREGAQVRIRVMGDTLHYSRTDYAPGRDAELRLRTAPLDARRKLALKRILGDLPRFQVFGSCFGKGMRFYLIDVPGGRFYRSLPERSGRCFADEPGIWGLFEDLDAFLAPPADPGDPDDPGYSAGVERPRS